MVTTPVGVNGCFPLIFRIFIGFLPTTLFFLGACWCQVYAACFIVHTIILYSYNHKTAHSSCWIISVKFVQLSKPFTLSFDDRFGDGMNTHLYSNN